MKLKAIILRAALLLFGLALLSRAFSPAQQLGPTTLAGRDWYVFWSGTRNFQLEYEGLQLFNPPWSLVFIWPITMWSFNVSWSLYASTTFLILLLSVPRSSQKWLWLVSIFLLLLSYQSLRQIMDGNLEAMIIAGTLLLLWAMRTRSVWGFALASAMLSAKFQETWLLLGVSGFWIISNWPKGKVSWTAAALLSIVAPFAFWKGDEWLNVLTRTPLIPQLVGGNHNVSLIASMTRLGIDLRISSLVLGVLLITTLLILRKVKGGISRFAAAGLIIASQLAAPYTSNTSMITPLAIGIVPLIQERPGIGLALTGLFNLIYLLLFSSELRFAWEATYWTTVLLISWAAMFIIEPNTGNVQSGI